eukprot:scaffold4013_cov429-Prasinococcus_capsulatus_cf.AAC.9
MTARVRVGRPQDRQPRLLASFSSASSALATIHVAPAVDTRLSASSGACLAQGVSRLFLLTRVLPDEFVAEVVGRPEEGIRFGLPGSGEVRTFVRQDVLRRGVDRESE